MLLHYTVSEDDYLAFNIYHARHTPNYKRTIIGMCLLIQNNFRLAGRQYKFILSFIQFHVIIIYTSR